MRDVVAVAHAALVRVGRAHAVAAIIEDATGQNGGRALEPNLPLDGAGGEPGLDGVELIAVEDRPPLAPVSLPPGRQSRQADLAHLRAAWGRVQPSPITLTATGTISAVNTALSTIPSPAKLP